MKKTILMLLLILSLGCVMTSSRASGEIEDVPGGKNLLNLGSLYTTTTPEHGYSETHMIHLTVGETYTAVMDYRYADHCRDIIGEFEFEDVNSSLTYSNEWIYDTVNERIYSEFVAEVEYIQIFSIPVPQGTQTSNYNVMLYEGDYASFDGFEPYLPTGFSFADSGTLAVDYDHLMSVEEIKNLVTAKDPNGNVIDKTVATDTYSGGTQLPGDYQILFQAESNQITRNYILDITVYDHTNPVITGPDKLTYEFSEKPSLETIKQELTVSDNVDTLTLSDITIKSDTYSAAIDLGTYAIDYEVTDQSGNTGTKTVLIDLVDFTPPNISGPGDLYIYTSDTPYTTTYILDQFTSTDFFDGNCIITITTDLYAGTQEVGIYRMILSSSDLHGNSTTKTIYIHVIDNRGPSFETDDLIIETTTNELLSMNDVMTQFSDHMATLNVKAENIEITYNEYDGNTTEAGDYYVYLSYDVNGQSESSRVLITVADNAWQFTPYYLLGLVPITGIVAFVLIKKRPV